MKDKKTHMNTQEILNQFHQERNHSENTIYIYRQSVRIFEKYTGATLPALLHIAEDEQDQNINWKHQTLKKVLIDFRKYLYDKYKIKTAKNHLTHITAIFRHYEITIEKLPYFSTKKAKQSTPIDPDLMVDRDILRLCININNPLLRAITLFMSSSGMSKADTLHLTVQDFIEATQEYHKTNHIPNALHILLDNPEVIGYWNNYKRQKTGQIYYTFSSNESTTAIVHYLLTREQLTPDAPLFDISPKYLSDLFKDTNDQLKLGKNGEYSRLTAHMLRRYHATQLAEAGMPQERIDLLQGRKPKTVAYQSYIKLKPSSLKEEYIKSLSYLVIEDVVRVKTELETVKEENRELKEKTEEINALWSEIKSIKEREAEWTELKK